MRKVGDAVGFEMIPCAVFDVFALYRGACWSSLEAFWSDFCRCITSVS